MIRVGVVAATVVATLGGATPASALPCIDSNAHEPIPEVELVVCVDETTGIAQANTFLTFRGSVVASANVYYESLVVWSTRAYVSDGLVWVTVDRGIENFQNYPAICVWVEIRPPTPIGDCEKIYTS